jgi:hypothetical protein
MVVSVSNPEDIAICVDKLRVVSVPVTVACHVSIIILAGPLTVVVRSMVEVMVLISVTNPTDHSSRPMQISVPFAYVLQIFCSTSKGGTPGIVSSSHGAM